MVCANCVRRIMKKFHVSVFVRWSSDVTDSISFLHRILMLFSGSFEIKHTHTQKISNNYYFHHTSYCLITRVVMTRSVVNANVFKNAENIQ